MNYFFALFIFVFGSIIGSFLNVVVLRHNTGKTIGGRSQCFSCGKQLHWYELFPVFSFAFLMGKCSKCKSKISWQYPLVEVITGTVFLLTIANATGPIETFVGLTPEAFASLFIRLISFCFLIAISVYDMKHKIIPDEWVYSFVGLSFVSLFFGPINGAVSSVIMPSVLDLFSGIILAAPFVLLWIISGGKWIGFGDAKLALGIGWFLGMVYGLSAIIIGFWIGAVISLILLGAGKTACSKAIRSLPAYFGLKHVSMKSEIPFAPFLILGLVLVYFFKWDVTGLGTLLAIMP